jgi:hypothetical protein
LGHRNGRQGRRTEPGVFQPDSAERAFVPEADALGARVDLNTGRRAIAVRAGFMEALIADPRVVLRFHGWVEQLATAPDTLNTDDVLPLVLEELGLRWPWCAMDILDTLHRMITLKIDDPVKAFPPMAAGVLAPPMVTVFEIQEGEAVDAVRARWQQLSAAVLGELDAAEEAVASGRIPKGEQHLRLWGRWFYEARVKRPAEPVIKIAARHHVDAGHPGRFENHDCRKQVRRAIDESERLLNLGEYFLRRPEETGKIVTP